MNYPPVKLEETAESSNITLIVSHPWLQEAFVRLLRDAGITVSVAESPQDLLQGVNETIDIVMVDVMAYQGQYQHLFGMIRDKQPAILIVALLTEHTAYQRGDVIRAGANGVVIKENADTELLSTLYSVLAGCHINKLSSKLLNAVKRCETLRKEEVNQLVEKKEREEARQGFFNLDRRSFLKGSAATVAAAGLMAASPSGIALKALADTNKAGTAADTEQFFYGSCRSNCFAGCRLKIKVRNGNVVQTEMAEFPDKRYNRVCLKGLAHVQRVYDPNRLKYPMKRVGERGAGQWERISWDEAVEIIGSTWQRLQAQYGKTSVAFSAVSGCFGNASFNIPKRLQNLMGACQIAANMDNAVFYGTTNAIGVGEYYNGNELADLLESRAILIWGANPADAQMQNWHFISEAKNNGAKIIVIDPHYTSTASKADIHVAIKPGTDSVLAMAMANVIVEENLIDEAFMKKSSVAPLLVKKADGMYLRRKDLSGEGEDFIVIDSATQAHGVITDVSDPAIRGTYTINGIEVTTAYDLLLERIKPYTVEYAAKFCEVPADTIREIALMYAKNAPATVYHGFGPDHYTNGHYAVFAAVMLAIITGNLGKPGASAGYQMPLGFFYNPASTMPAGAAAGPTLAGIRLLDVVNEGKYGDIPINLKSIYIYSGNPVGNMTERKAYLEAISKMEMVVVADMTMTDTAHYADIVLPVAHWFEVDDMHGSISQVPYLILQEKAIEPLYESKSDWDIIRLLGKRMGFAEHFDMDAEQLMELSLDSAYAKVLGMSYEKLKKEKVLRDVPPKPYIYGESGVFPTATKRAQFYVEQPKPQMNFGQQMDIAKERLPYWEPPNEAWDENPLYKKYPLIYGQERPKWRVHTQWSHTPWLKELDPEPIIKLNPKDADARGIKAGDKVKVFNDRGHVVLKAVISNGTRPGMIVVPKGWQIDQYIDGHYQDLTSRVSNAACINNCFYDALVEVQKL